MTVLSALIWILLGIIVLLAVLLLAPISFSIQAWLEETAGFEGVLAWAGGLAALQINAASDRAAGIYLRCGRWTRQLHWGKAAARKGPSQKLDFSWVNLANPYLDKKVFKEVFSYLFRMERSLDLKLSFAGEIGFGDEELTGFLAGLLAALNAGPWECNLQPNFTETVLNFRGAVRGRVIPARVFWLTGCLLFSAPVRSAWWRQLKKSHAKHRDQSRGQNKEAIAND